MVAGIHVGELRALGLARLHVALEGHLEGDLGRRRAGIGVEDPRESRRGDGHKPLGQLNGERVREAEHRGVRHAAQLRADRLVELRHPVAVHVAPQRGGAIKVPAAVGIDQLASLTGNDHRRSLLFPGALLGKRVPQHSVIAAAEVVALRPGHGPNATGACSTWRVWLLHLSAATAIGRVGCASCWAVVLPRLDSWLP